MAGIYFQTVKVICCFYVVTYVICVYQVFNMESEYNTKNRQRMLPMDDRTQWEDVFGVGNVYAVSTGRVRCTE